DRSHRGDRCRGENGSSLVMAVAVMLIVFTLGAVWLALADHQSGASVHDRDRQRAIDAANAGLVVAASALATNPSYTGTAVTAFPGGAAEYQVNVSVDASDSTRRVVTSTGYAPNHSSP